jgi:23S rRNA (uracil1939-C5)-methyltransferase
VVTATANFSSEPTVVEKLTIDHVGQRGDGVAIAGAIEVFVPYTLPAETVEVEEIDGHPDRKQLLKVEAPSPDRIEAFCKHFGVCGGCAIQHWQIEKYRAWKRELVISAMRRAGIEAPVDDLIDAHGEGRRRATFHARRGGHDILQVGFTAAASHRIVPIDRCPILAPAMSGALDAARALAGTLDSRNKPLDIQVTATDNGLDVDVRGSGALPPATMTSLARIAAEHRLARLTRHGETVLLRAPPAVRMGSATITLPPGSFLQATAAGEEALADRVLAQAGKTRNIADLFCGVGPFALRFAARSKVDAFDNDAGSIEALKKAVANTRGLKPVAAQARDLFRRPLMPIELKHYETVVFDPPRQGAEAQSRQLAASTVPVIVAVSCNASTFARDARILIDGGYRLELVTPVDQFKYTAHVELVARFTR